MDYKEKYARKLKHPSWQLKRLKIYERDGGKCRMCDDADTELNVHHLKYTKDNLADEPDENLVTVCSHCHFLIEEFKKRIPAYPIIAIRKIKNIFNKHDCYVQISSGAIVIATTTDKNEYEIITIIGTDTFNSLAEYFKNSLQSNGA